MERRKFFKVAGAGATLALFDIFSKGSLAGQGSPIILENFPVYKQETPFTCGPSSVRMTLEFLGHPLPEKDIARRMGTKKMIGTSHGMLIRAYRKYLAELETGFTVEKITGKAATEDAVESSLKQGLPIIASFLTENHFKPGTSVGHYCVIIGIDREKKEFTLANPFGYKESIGIDHFWRLAEWNPGPGDIPGVKNPKILPFRLPRTLVVLEKN